MREGLSAALLGGTSRLLSLLGRGVRQNRVVGHVIVIVVHNVVVIAVRFGTFFRSRLGCGLRSEGGLSELLRRCLRSCLLGGCLGLGLL